MHALHAYCSGCILVRRVKRGRLKPWDEKPTLVGVGGPRGYIATHGGGVQPWGSLQSHLME